MTVMTEEVSSHRPLETKDPACHVGSPGEAPGPATRQGGGSKGDAWAKVFISQEGMTKAK